MYLDRKIAERQGVSDNHVITIDKKGGKSFGKSFESIIFLLFWIAIVKFMIVIAKSTYLITFVVMCNVCATCLYICACSFEKATIIFSQFQ